MALVPLYRVKPHVKAPKWAKFPDDFHVVAEAKVDDNIVDHPLISGYRWNFKDPDKKSKTGRARRSRANCTPRSVYLTRTVWEIVNGPIPGRLTVDHKNLDSLDDRIENLRLANQNEQNRNRGKKRIDSASTPYKGSAHHPYGSSKAKKYHGVISPANYPMFCLGYYHTSEEAGFAYNCAAALYYGEFAHLNEIPPDSISPDRQQEIRSMVERKLRDRGLIPSES